MDKAFWETLTDKQLEVNVQAYADMAQGRKPMPGHLTTGKCWSEHKTISDILAARAKEKAAAK